MLTVIEATPMTRPSFSASTPKVVPLPHAATPKARAVVVAMIEIVLRRVVRCTRRPLDRLPP
jgi:hypothetical protein